MSVSYFSLLVLLLCLSLHCCCGRPITTKHKQTSSFDRQNAKNNNNKGFDESSRLAASNAKAVSTTSDTSIDKTEIKTSRTEDHANQVITRKTSKDDRTIHQSGKINHSSTNHVEIEADQSRKSVSKSKPWHVPNKKRPREEHPSFNLDYMQPITHPPHHN